MITEANGNSFGSVTCLDPGHDPQIRSLPPIWRMGTPGYDGAGNPL